MSPSSRWVTCFHRLVHSPAPARTLSPVLSTHHHLISLVPPPLITRSPPPFHPTPSAWRLWHLQSARVHQAKGKDTDWHAVLSKPRNLPGSTLLVQQRCVRLGFSLFALHMMNGQDAPKMGRGSAGIMARCKCAMYTDRLSLKIDARPFFRLRFCDRCRHVGNRHPPIRNARAPRPLRSAQSPRAYEKDHQKPGAAHPGGVPGQQPHVSCICCDNCPDRLS